MSSRRCSSRQVASHIMQFLEASGGVGGVGGFEDCDDLLDSLRLECRREIFLLIGLTRLLGLKGIFLQD